MTSQPSGSSSRADLSLSVVLRYSFVSLCHRVTGVSMAGCPSGQWKRTVNPSAYAYAGSIPAPATHRKGPLTSAFAGWGPLVVVRLCPTESGHLRLVVGNTWGSCAPESPA